ncbi:hypothetical protein B0H12DRAFT_1094750 [Mycena haematopus]|nr:hypothetical protein B0H12DRAFT_1094750 [Mycena haematopus]
MNVLTDLVVLYEPNVALVVLFSPRIVSERIVIVIPYIHTRTYTYIYIHSWLNSTISSILIFRRRCKKRFAM